MQIKLLGTILALLVLAASPSAQQPVPFTPASFNCWGSSAVSADGPRVVVTRKTPRVDAGCDFRPRTAIDQQHARIEMLPSASLNGGYYTVAILAFDNANVFLGESVWISDTQSTAPQVLADIRQWLKGKNIDGATRFTLRIRVQPQDKAGVAFVFRSITIGPASVPTKGAAQQKRKSLEPGVWNLGGQPPFLVAHYMPWFEIDRSPKDPTRTWKYWSWNGPGPAHDPDKKSSEGRRDIASTIYPLIGPYSSWSRAVVRYQLQTAHAAGVQAFLVNWMGPGSPSDERIPLLLEEATRADIKIAICYEEKLNFFPEYRSLPTRTAVGDAVVADLTYVIRRYSAHPAYLKRNGLPFILQFNAWGSSKRLGSSGLTPDEFEHVFSRLPAKVVYGRQNLDGRYHPSVQSAFIWWAWKYEELDRFSEEAASLRDSGSLEFFMTQVSVCFDDAGVFGWGQGTRKSAACGQPVLSETMKRALSRSPELVQIVTWNDFPESTAVEPTLEHGFKWLDEIEKWWDRQLAGQLTLSTIASPF